MKIIRIILIIIVIRGSNMMKNSLEFTLYKLVYHPRANYRTQ